jgi:DNA-binding PadR family transcriptional regulator
VTLAVATLGGPPWQPRGVERRPNPSLNEWAVLGVLVEKPRHGYDIAAELRAGTPVGDVWHLSRQLVYRALERLQALGLVEPRRTEPSTAGPPRTVYGPTARGRTELRRWLVTPVKHIRDVRNAFLLKLVVTEQLGLDPDDLIRAQRGAFADLLDERAVEPARTDHVALWRHHSAAAVATFLDALGKPGR